MTRTRIKICGITRREDLIAALDAGVDAIGLVFYAPSARSLTVTQARELRRRIPPFVACTALFVNPNVEEVENILDVVRPDVLQFHGSEDDGFCASFGRPFIKAAPVGPAFDLLHLRGEYPHAGALLLDTPSIGHGGSGKAFDWTLLPADHTHPDALPLVLSGGLNAANVGAAIGQVRPYAVDVSSGVESAKGIKDAQRIREFVAAVKAADEQRNSRTDPHESL
jgi:phosphoribosylanthranilate isomerase